MTEQIQEILNFYKENKLVYIDREGKHTVDISDFCKQQTSDILQKTNRTEKVLLNLAEKNSASLKWVNDYAMAKIIEYLKAFNDDATQQIIEQETTIQKLELELENNRQSKATVVLKDDYANLQDKYTALEEKFNKSVEAYKTLKVERDDLQNKLLATSQNMSHEYDELAVKYNELKTDFDGLQNESNTIANKLNEVEEKCKREIQANENLQNQFDKLNTEYNDKVTELTQRDNQIKTLIEERDTALENEDVAIKQLESGVEKREKIINELKTRVNKLNDDLNEAQSMNNKSKEYIVALENKLIEEQDKSKENAEKIESICNILSINNDTKHDEKQRQSSSNGMHRMGDNQVVNATFL